MNQRQFDRDLDPEDLPASPLRRLFDDHRQASHKGETEDPDWCYHCNAWVYHAEDKCPKLKIKP